MVIYLYVKTHKITGLKYLGKTSNKDPHKYSGSGKYWQRHLKKYGKDYDTQIICECHSEEDLKEKGLYYSNLWNVVESDDWANLKEEAGDGGSHGIETRRKIGESAKGRIPWNKGKTGIYSSETLQSISNARKGSKHSTETKQKMSEADRSHYTRTAPVSVETREKLANLRRGKPGKTLGLRWSEEQKAEHSKRLMGRACPTKGRKRIYREDGSFYFGEK